MTDVKFRFDDFEDVPEAARQLLDLAGDDRSQIRTADDGFVVSKEFAEKHHLLDDGYDVVDLPDDEADSGGGGTDADDTGGSTGPEAFDPSTRNVDDVVAHLAAADEAERARVLEAEAAGKKRKGVLEWTAGE